MTQVTAETGASFSAPEHNVVDEKPVVAHAGLVWLGLDILLGLAAIASAIIGGSTENGFWAIPAIVFGLATLIIAISFYMLKPNEAAVRTLFGDYRGTDRTAGLRIGNPLYSSFKISLRVRNFTTTSSKVNDANGNPINIAAVVVWRVVETAHARFGVDDFDDYVRIQSEAAVRQLARSYPYESFDDPEATTLIGEPGEVNRDLQRELQERADAAGVDIIEARVTDLSYATEVADAMLRRQQAAAIVAGRSKIVEGAVGMVQEAMAKLEVGGDDYPAVEFSPERKAAFAANLMTVITSESPTSPVVNVGGDPEL